MTWANSIALNFYLNVSIPSIWTHMSLKYNILDWIFYTEYTNKLNNYARIPILIQFSSTNLLIIRFYLNIIVDIWLYCRWYISHINLNWSWIFKMLILRSQILMTDLHLVSYTKRINLVKSSLNSHKTINKSPYCDIKWLIFSENSELTAKYECYRLTPVELILIFR